MGESQHGVIFLSAFHLVKPMWSLQKTSSTFTSFTSVWRQTLSGPRMKIHFHALAKQASPPSLCWSSACSRELERAQIFPQVSSPLPSPQMLQRAGLIEGRPPQGQEGRRPRLSPETTTRWPKSFFLLLQQKMNGPFIAWQDFSCGLTTCAALSVFSVQRTHLPGAGLLLLQSCKSFLSSDPILSKGSLQVAAKMTEVILITSGALPSSVSRLWILEGIKVRCCSWVFRSPSPFLALQF